MMTSLQGLNSNPILFSIGDSTNPVVVDILSISSIDMSVTLDCPRVILRTGHTAMAHAYRGRMDEFLADMQNLLISCTDATTGMELF